MNFTVKAARVTPGRGCCCFSTNRLPLLDDAELLALLSGDCAERRSTQDKGPGKAARRTPADLDIRVPSLSLCMLQILQSGRSGRTAESKSWLKGKIGHSLTLSLCLMILAAIQLPSLGLNRRLVPLQPSQPEPVGSRSGSGLCRGEPQCFCVLS